ELSHGAKEYSEVTVMEGKKYLRVMQPLYMEQGCMKCHAWTRLKVGDLRGATDVAIPLEKYEIIAHDNTKKLILIHLVLWLIGMLSIYFFGRKLIDSERNNKASLEELSMRTQALDQSGSAIMITDTQGTIEYANEAFLQLNGFKLDEVLGRKPVIIKSHLNPPSFYKEMWATISEGKTWKGEFKNRKKNGSIYWCHETISPITDSNGVLTHYIAFIEDIEERKAAEAHIKQLAQFDALTNLPNRRYFHQKLEEQIIQAQKKGKLFGLIYVDLDRFKMVNDSLGHTIGDSLLITLAERLMHMNHTPAFVTRLGGDEFAIITELGDTKEDVELCADAIQQTIKQPFFIENNDLFITASIGIALYPKNGDHSEALIKSADLAMYGAKINGKNRYLFFEPIHGDFASETLLIENGLRKAIDNNELFLVYQPKWNTKENRFIGLEVLVRWQSPTLGFMPPSRFIKIAEETDLIINLGEWILKEAIIKMMEISKIIGFIPKISVNLSPIQFRHENLNSMIKDTLLQTNFPANKLELEITEGALVQDPAMAIEKMNELYAYGVTFSIDDFGTGYSSMSYLKKFPVSTLKIDKSFVDEIIDDPHDRAIVQAIITLAASFKIDTIAEGAETREQVDILSTLGCHAIQGYWHSRPIDYSALVEYFKNLEK
ncbi:MAG TPA: EAL domain-containing protein, partial [Sulfuricurvum sp.]|nr:EAL domain-containing protein [Sulfuricurvum sp.]